MKTMKKKLMTLLMVLLAAHSALAYDFEADGLYYNINVDSTLTVTRGLERYSGDIIIPNTVVHDGKTYTVSEIGYAAFASSNDLTSVVMGDSIKHIVTDAFNGSKNLKNVTLGKSVLTIGSFAFAGCSSLTQFTIPDAVTKICTGTFMGCSNLASAAIGDGVTAIENMAFSDCSHLSEINLGRNVASVEEDAFNNCTGLTRVNIKDLTAWCHIDFAVSALSNPLYYAHHLFLDGQEITDLTIPETITRIGNFTFNGCIGLTSVNLGNVTTIGYASFSSCSGLKTIDFGETVTTIENSAFSNCSGLTELFFPCSITSIEEYAFDECDNVTSVQCLSVIPPELQGWHTFSNICYQNATLTVPKNSIDSYKASIYWRQFKKIVESEFGDVVPGDVNCDGEVTIADANAVIDIIINNGGNNGHNRAPDVNIDGEISIADVNAIIDFILNDSSPTAEPEYVDLGLPSGTLWATKNIGATTPEDYGDYFAWGETEPKDSYLWETYKWGYIDSYGQWFLSKYNMSTISGAVDNITELELADDAAYVIYGASWRMPTWEQACELVEYCNWTWTSKNGVSGQLGTGPNGNTLFLPAAGNVYGNCFYSPGNQGWSGEYLTTALTLDDSYCCGYLLISTLGTSINYNCSRFIGHSIRAVRVSK